MHSEWRTSYGTTYFYHLLIFSQPFKMESTTTQSRAILASEVFKQDPKLSVRAAARIHRVSATTLRRRRVGGQARHNKPINSKKLTNLEELVILKRILDLDS